MKKLSELVSSAIDDAKAKIASAVEATAAPKAGTKIASAAAPVPSTPKVANKGEECEDDKDDKDKKKYEKTAALQNAESAMKFAENLDVLGTLWPKLSHLTSGTPAGAPETFVSPNKGATQDSNTKATSIPTNMATTGGDGGKGRDVETNRHDAPYAAKAAQAMLDAKLAQSEALKLAGRAQEAEKVANEARVEFEKAKKAYEEEDATTRTPKGNPQTLPLNRHPGDLPVPQGPARDNEGMRHMTKRDAITQFVRQGVSPHIKEPAFSSASDKGLTDNLEHTEGAKIASIIAGVKHRKTTGAAAS